MERSRSAKTAGKRRSKTGKSGLTTTLATTASRMLAAGACGACELRRKERAVEKALALWRATNHLLSRSRAAQ